MRLKQLLIYISSDLYRYTGKCNFALFARYYLFGRGFHYTFWLRVTKYLYCNKLLFPIFLLSRLNLYRLSTKYGIEISHKCEIGYGFYIGHFGGIVISNSSKIGNNVNISHGVTLGQTNRGSLCGSPIIKDEVYIGPGAKLIGNIIISDKCAIGANAVVTKSFDKETVIAGVPASVISNEGSKGYIQYTWITK